MTRWFDHIEFLKNTKLFGALCAEEIEKLYSIAIKKSFESGSEIYSEGSPGDSVYVLIDGTLRITVAGVQVEQYSDPGTAFGETGFLQNLPRSATLYAVDRCDFLIFPREALWGFIHEIPSAGVKILTQLALGSSKKLQVSARRYADRIKKTPLSTYHQNPSLLDKPVVGSLLSFDLKKSEVLLRKQMSGLDANEVLSRAVFPFRMLMASYDGIEVSNQGDGVGIFFPLESLSASQIIQEILPKFFSTKADLEKLFRQDQIQPENWHMNYRISIGFDSLTPSFELLKSSQAPVWRESKGQLFTESARLNEIEKNVLNPEKNKTVIIMSNAFIEKVKAEGLELDPLWIGTPMRSEGKHGVIWIFNVLMEEDLHRVSQVA